MPSNTIKSFAKKANKTVAEVEKLWKKAKKLAEKEGQKNNYAYITGILKKMLKLEYKLYEDTPPAPTNTQNTQQTPEQQLQNAGFSQDAANFLKQYNITVDQINQAIQQSQNEVNIQSLDGFITGVIMPLMKNNWAFDQIIKHIETLNNLGVR